MKCPGQDTRYWKPSDIFEAPCPACGKTVEFFKDDAVRKCAGCGSRVANPHLDFGCATYCKFASQCLKELPPEVLARQKHLFAERVACEMRTYFGDDEKRIRHAEKVAQLAEQIAAGEAADMAVVLTAAYLHDIGIKDAERMYHSTAANYQEQLGPLTARGILQGLHAGEQLVDEVCDIIGHHHHPRPVETANFMALYDADLIVNIQEGDIEKPRERDRLSALIESRLLTSSGRRVAQEVFELPPSMLSGSSSVGETHQ
ncbi:MAG: HD domain-containing protein [Deltaproteobacteria bacterium]|nr:HD domain-containing protein [Deltaproteobacteria bacterium]